MSTACRRTSAPSISGMRFSGPGGICVISPARERLSLIELPEAPHNLAFGGPDSRDLYVTALTSV